MSTAPGIGPKITDRPMTGPMVLIALASSAPANIERINPIVCG
ncbi:hypothetical protein ABT120_29825 [Nonomuraea angiospora]